MYGVELYAAVRLAVVDEGLSHHEAGRRFGIDRRTVKKMLSYSAPPGYRRTKPVRRPKLDGFTGIVDAILEADTDPEVPRKQRHTAHRIFERLRDEHGFSGGYTIVKDYVRSRRQSVREAFVPLHHPPGHAQVDFGEATVEVGGRREKVAFFCLILPHSNVWFVKAYPRETTEAFLDGHVSALAFLGGVPRSILYDNTTLAVARILGDGTRRRTQAFTHLQSHYLFRDRFGRPGKGNDKGKVEALVKTARRRFMVPIPKVHDLSILNERLLARCLERLDALEAGGHLGSDFPVERRHWAVLCSRIQQLLDRQAELVPLSCPEEVERHAQRIAAQLLNSAPSGGTGRPDLQTVDVGSLELIRPRSVGVEHVGLWAMERLGLEALLERLGFNGTQRALAMATVIARMAAPGSERASWRWLCERSALGELLGVDFERMSMMRLYRVSDALMAQRAAIEAHLFDRATDLFGLRHTVTLYDLTNTFFEGEAAAQSKARRGHSKEKRSDCPLLNLGLVLDGSGFVRRSEQPLAGRGRRMVTLADTGTITPLRRQLERGLEEVHEQSRRRVELLDPQGRSAHLLQCHRVSLCGHRFSPPPPYRNSKGCWCLSDVGREGFLSSSRSFFVA